VSRLVETSHLVVLFFFLENHALKNIFFCVHFSKYGLEAKEVEFGTADPSKTTKTTLHASSDNVTYSVPDSTLPDATISVGPPPLEPAPSALVSADDGKDEGDAIDDQSTSTLSEVSSSA
jgi:hypothetical protein